MKTQSSHLHTPSDTLNPATFPSLPPHSPFRPFLLQIGRVRAPLAWSSAHVFIPGHPPSSSLSPSPTTHPPSQLHGHVPRPSTISCIDLCGPSRTPGEPFKHLFPLRSVSRNASVPNFPKNPFSSLSPHPSLRVFVHLAFFTLDPPHIPGK